jgi:hypothetical protein
MNMQDYSEKQYAAIGGSGQNYVGQIDTAPDVSSTFFGPVKGARQGIIELTARLNSLAARLTGPVPPTASNAAGLVGSKLQSVPNGLFDEIADVGRSMNGSITEAFDALNRIERSLP